MLFRNVMNVAESLIKMITISGDYHHVVGKYDRISIAIIFIHDFLIPKSFTISTKLLQAHVELGTQQISIFTSLLYRYWRTQDYISNRFSKLQHNYLLGNPTY